MKELIRRRPVLVVAGAIAVSVVSLVALVFVVGRGLPPRTVVMTTGPEGSAYQEFGEKYRAALARDGIRLELRPSLGNLENLARLNDASSGVSVGFVASGLTTEKASPGIESLGTISYEPIWIFCRGLSDQAQFGELRGKRLSIDPQGAIMLELLRAMGLEKEVTVVPLGPAGGGEALLRGDVDCACMLTVADDPIVKRLLADDRVNPMTAQRADALVALYPYLSKVTIPRGAGSLAKDLPAQDVTLVAPTASLLVRRDLHPAVQYLLLQAAQDIHSGPGILRRPGQFPAAEPEDVPLSREARTYYKSGGSFFQRHLPFWLAVIASRLVVVLVPLLGLLYPLLRVLPLVLAFAFERRVNALYADLRRIDARIVAGDPAGEIAADLARLDDRIVRTRVSASRARELYALKHHASLVADRLRERTAAARPQRI
ncbi:MAG TPA: TAXI family TRAP transporter solute-binding subunit [Thermoanaerobaculia bacterium]|nr:TAXI family TRAP transporter solute-binding subunit [Thermoanaerobaculia bacterium]